MIYAFTGKNGSGKTYQMIKMAYKQWKKGVDIYSNTILFFPEPKNTPLRALSKKLTQITFRLLKKPYRAKKFGQIVYFEEISEIMEVNDGIIIFDEAQVLFDSHNWQNLSEDFRYKLQQHRKHRLDLYCTTQDLMSIDITYRRLIHTWYEVSPFFRIGKDPVYFGLFRQCMKDTSRLHADVDTSLVATIETYPFIIWRYSQRLYDTFYDIGFRRFKVLWLNIQSRGKNTSIKKIYIIPKRMSLKNALTQIYSLNSACGTTKYKYSKTNSKSSATNI